MRFTKMHGAGNDYVYVNCFEEPYPPDAAELAQKSVRPALRHRRRRFDFDLPQ